jgi:hypothetical protein
MPVTTAKNPPIEIMQVKILKINNPLSLQE